MATGGTTTAAGPVVQVLPQPRIQPAVAAAPAIDAAPQAAPISSGWVAPWQLIALGAFVLLSVAFVMLERRRRRSPRRVASEAWDVGSGSQRRSSRSRS